MSNSPENSASTQLVLKDIKNCFSRGEFFLAHDLSIQAFRNHPEDWVFAHLAVLSLANAGATGLALEKFEDLHLSKWSNVETLCLKGRLYKDLGFENQTGTDRIKALLESFGFYFKAYELAMDAGNPELAYYPAINAATTALFAQENAKSLQLAKDVLALVNYSKEEDFSAIAPDYWKLATTIEALFLLGRTQEAAKLIPQALNISQHNYTQLASTGRQLRRIAQTLQLDEHLTDAFTPPGVIHFAGHIISESGRFQFHEESQVRAEIEKQLDAHQIGVAYGSLAAGADILFAEALLSRGVDLHIILPFNSEEFIQYSVACSSPNWIARFENCLAQAKTVRYATEDRYLGDDHLFAYASQLAMGLAVLCARHMLAPLKQLVVWDGVATPSPVGTVADMRTWQQAGFHTEVIRCGKLKTPEPLGNSIPTEVKSSQRDTRAMLFADVHGFSKLSDAQLPVFMQEAMGALARVVDRFRSKLETVNTWGDGIFIVFRDAAIAAQCALELQQAFQSLDLKSLSLPESLSLRIGGHLGPVYQLEDQVTGRNTAIGAHVSRAARIEPVTPEGCVYVTETFAAVLAMTGGDQFNCDYVGYTAAAKNYGSLRMFLLRGNAGLSGPTLLQNIETLPDSLKVSGHDA